MATFGVVGRDIAASYSASREPNQRDGEEAQTEGEDLC